ncbi:MAG: hypothetical protein WDA02_09350 [Saccharofermentanales bacterium]
MNIIKKFNEFKLLLERNLNFTELNKNNRWNVLFDKLKNDESFNVDFTDKNGKKIKDNVKILNRDYILYEISKNGNKSELDIEKAEDFFKEGDGYYYDIFEIISNGKKYYIRLNDIVKNKEFGSSSNLSSGTVDSTLKESMFAFCFSLLQYYYKTHNISKLPYNINKLNDIIFDKDGNIIKDIIDHIKIPIVLDKDIINDEINENNSEWVNSYIDITNKFIPLLLNKKYIFYHNSFKGDIPNLLNEIFYKYFKNYNVPFRVNINKWNPSDIYAVNINRNENIINKLKEQSGNKDNLLDNITNLITTYFNNKSLIGISIKKTKTNSNNSIHKKNEKYSIFKYNGFEVSKNPLDTMSIKIYANRNNIKETLLSKISTGNDISNNSLEILGNNSKYGRISYSFINYILSMCNLNEIPHYKEIEKLDNDELINKINSIYLNINDDFKRTKQSNMKFNIKESKSKLISKYQSLLLIKLLEDNKNIYSNILYQGRKMKKSDFIITQIFNFGYSRNNIIFKTPPYYYVYSQ